MEETYTTTRWHIRCPHADVCRKKEKTFCSFGDAHEHLCRHMRHDWTNHPKLADHKFMNKLCEGETAYIFKRTEFHPSRNCINDDLPPEPPLKKKRDELLFSICRYQAAP